MTNGTIKSFDYSKGSGVIEQDNGGENVTVHFSAVKSKNQRTLQPGQRVQFDLNRDAAGLRATNVEILDDGTTQSATVISANSAQSARVAPPNRNSRAKSKLWPLGIGGVAALGALFMALGSRSRVQSPPPPTAATSPVSAAMSTKKSAVARPLAPKPIVVRAPAPLPGEQFAQTRMRELSDEEAQSLTPAQLQYALNEIYARHGYRFVASKVRQQFRSFAWYKPVEGQSQVASWQKFSALEKHNAQLLNQARSAQREEEARQTQIAQSYQADQKRLAERDERDQITRQQVAQARQNEPQPSFDSSDRTTPDSSASATFDSDSSGDFTATGKPIFTGPRGGRYHISKNGNKVYEKRR